MLKIRAEQQAALDRAAAVEFERRVVRHVREVWKPDQTDDATRATVAGAIARAKVHGFTSERELVTYVDLTYAFGAGFDVIPWAAAILGDPSLLSAAKAALLYRRGRQEAER